MSEGVSRGSSTGAAQGSTAPGADLDHLAHRAAIVPRRAPGRWYRAGISARTERNLDVASAAVVVLLVAGWTWSITMAVRGRLPGMGVGSTAATMAAALTNPDAASTAYLTDATLNALVKPLRGASGKLRVEIASPGKPIADSTGGATLRVESPDSSGASVVPRSGIFRLVAAIGSALKPVGDFSLI